MAASDLTTANFIFQKKYADGVSSIATRLHPQLDRLAKKAGFTGTSFAYAIKTTNPQGVSGSFAKAQTNTGASTGYQLTATRAVKYGNIVLNGEAMQACKDRGAFIDLVSMETDGILEELGDSLAFDLYRGGNGIRGQRASASTNVITLATPDDARSFKINMVVGASPNADGSSPRTGTTSVTAVDIDGGKITLASAAAITSFADNDYLFRDGDVGTCLQGFDVCTPLVAPTAGDSFRGIDRSAIPALLAGSRLSSSDSTGNDIEENAGRVAIKINQNGRTADEVNLNPVNFWQVVRRAGAKIKYEGGGGDAGLYFEKAILYTPAGALRMYSDPDCPVTVGRVGRSDGHYIKTLLEFPHVISDDGNYVMRSPSADAIESRARAWGQYIQSDTAAFGVWQI